MGTFGERVRNRRKEKDITLEKIEEETGISNSNLSKIERNKISPSLNAAIMISNCLDESLDYLAKGIVKYDELNAGQQELIEGYNLLDENNQHALKAYTAFLLSQKYLLKEVLNKTRAPEPAPDPEPEPIKEEKRVYLPILGTAAAGTPILTEELLEGFLSVPTAKINKNSFLIRVKGESMIEAGINTGDLVIINPQPTVETGEIALVKVAGEVTIKKFHLVDSEVRLKPANCSMKDIVVNDLTKIKVLGKVIGVIPAEEANQNMIHEFNGPNE